MMMNLICIVYSFFATYDTTPTIHDWLAVALPNLIGN
jgi:hypothetical protein